MSASRLHGWSSAPRVGVVVPVDGQPGWTDAAFWCAVLDAWGVPAVRVSPGSIDAGPIWTTLIVPTPLIDGPLADRLTAVTTTSLLLTGGPHGATERLEDRHRVAWFHGSADARVPATSEETVDAAQTALSSAAPDGLVALWRWPRGKSFALVVDGDVDHPSGVDPECARYVAPAIETALRAGFDAYGIFAAAANLDAEPASFPAGAEYYNHSYSHPYSHWNANPWEALDASQMRDELTRSDEAFRRHVGTDDHRIFRLPHFQLAAGDRTYDVLEELGYLADSSIGGNVSVTGGLPFHPARRPWSDRPADAAYARTHPDPSGRRPFLQLPISTDPTDPGFPHGCCSYNTLDEGVRRRTADPEAYEEVLQDVVDSSCTRQGLAHLFIDPPDAGFGRLPGDAPDYASAVERWLHRAAHRDDVAMMSASELATWWVARERAIEGFTSRVEHGALIVDVPDAPDGMTLAVLPPGGAARWRPVATTEEART